VEHQQSPMLIPVGLAERWQRTLNLEIVLGDINWSHSEYSCLMLTVRRCWDHVSDKRIVSWMCIALWRKVLVFFLSIICTCSFLRNVKLVLFFFTRTLCVNVLCCV
jgi:hypothetical protein